ncbi:hypothetical protein ILT44_11570 [Microvirga sp. BT689]|uniref:hypothetical protein n=1 Tax=Microvirga arvi TaxID=2778731 RepID=UPI0019513BC6|nr:hypothetical protein [Microvirga arvi]MBM6580823.1 hypothetical protein [Microvirga arvi]
MVTDSRVLWKGPVISMLAMNLFSTLLSAQAAVADDLTPGHTQEIASRVAGTSSERFGPASTPARKPTRRPDGAGNFVYEIINQIQVQSKELCARYGNPADCLEEAEVCLTMRDNGDNQIRLCLNTVSGGSGGTESSAQKLRVRR